jgi:hypothetical protein
MRPFKGYLLDPPYGQANCVNENFPGSAQIQVTGINDKADTVGFWANAKRTRCGFVEWNGVPHRRLHAPGVYLVPHGR